MICFQTKFIFEEKKSKFFLFSALKDILQEDRVFFLELHSTEKKKKQIFLLNPLNIS